MKDDRLHIRISSLLKSEIENIIFDMFWNDHIEMDISTFVRSAIIREIKRIKRNNKNKEK